jgi:Mitochondrial carrier protein
VCRKEWTHVLRHHERGHTFHIPSQRLDSSSFIHTLPFSLTSLKYSAARHSGAIAAQNQPTMRFIGRRIPVVIGTVWGLLLIFLSSESHAFVGGPSFSNALVSRSVRPLHLLNVNRVTKKRKSAEHSALYNPRHHSPLDNILIPSSTALQPKQQQHDHITPFDKTMVIGFIGVFGSILYKFVTNSAPGSWRYFLAGGLCAASSHAIPTPIDVIKVRCMEFGKKKEINKIHPSSDYFSKISCCFPRQESKSTRDLPTSRFWLLDMIS